MDFDLTFSKFQNMAKLIGGNYWALSSAAEKGDCNMIIGNQFSKITGRKLLDKI